MALTRVVKGHRGSRCVESNFASRGRPHPWMKGRTGGLEYWKRGELSLEAMVFRQRSYKND